MVEIAPQTHMGAVELSVSDLDRSLDYWQRVVGLRVLGRDNGAASLGTDTELVRFVEEPGSQPADRHGIEIYADRPRELWEGHVRERMTTLSLDVENLLAELGDPATEPFDGLPDGTAVGHVHLRVANVDSTVAFYR